MLFHLVELWPMDRPRGALLAEVGQISNLAECTLTVIQNRCLRLVSSAFRTIPESRESTGGRGVRDLSSLQLNQIRKKARTAMAAMAQLRIMAEQ